MGSLVDKVVIRLELDQKPSFGEDLWKYWLAGGPIFEALKENGYIDSKGTV